MSVWLLHVDHVGLARDRRKESKQEERKQTVNRVSDDERAEK